MLSYYAIHSLHGLIGWVWVARLMPFIIVGPVVSPYVDRLTRKIPFMISVDLGRLGLSLGVAIAFLLDGRAYWLLVLVLGESILSVSYTSARNAWVTRAYHTMNIGRINGALQAIGSATMVAGTVLGPLIVRGLGIVALLVTLAASYFFVVVCLGALARIPDDGVPGENGVGIMTRGLLGAPHIQRLTTHPIALIALIAAAGWGLGGGASNVVNALIGVQQWHAGALSISVTFGAMALGSIAATLVVRLVHPETADRWLSLAGCAMFAEGIGQIAFGHTGNMVLGGVLAVVVGLFSGAGDVGFDTAVMTGVAEQYQARAFSLIWMASSVSLSASSLGFNDLVCVLRVPGIANLGGGLVALTGIVTIVLSYATLNRDDRSL
ncbi:Major facilitator superfamily MFS_1 [Sulfobacillus acidophilus TPY]|nr:Major facilitator superfamily MFS_1 [Sulfobacillus acidophilus TPY]